MQRRGTNLPRVGSFNQRVVLDLIRRTSAGISRAELATRTGLSQQTVSNIVLRLLTDGLVEEGERRIEGRGKPATMLRIRPHGGFAVGVHVDPVVTTSVLVDLHGDLVGKVATETPWGPDAAVAAVSAAVDDMLAEVDVGRSAVLGLGVAAPGPIDLPGGRVVHPPLLDGWEEVPLRDLLAGATGLPVLLEKDVSAAMVAELWRGQQVLQGTALFFYVGFGVAVAVAHDGELLAGSSRNAGEVGHLAVDADGPPCSCGNRGCIGVSTAAQTLVGQAVDRGVLPAGLPAGSPRDLDAALWRLCDVAAAGDTAAVDILSTSARRVAVGVRTIADLVDASAVVFGGPCWARLEPYYVPIVQADLERHATLREVHPVQVLGSAVGDHVGAVGAASLVLDDLFTPRPTGLLAPTAAASPPLR